MSGTTDDDETAEPTCHCCGEQIAESDRQRIVTKVVNQQVVYLRFCGDACLEEWRSSGELERWQASDE